MFTDLHEVARHEAGHAVMAHHLDIPFDRIEMARRGNSRARVILPTPPRPRAAIKVALAGAAAQSIHSGRDPWDLLFNGAGHDDVWLAIDAGAATDADLGAVLDEVITDLRSPALHQRLAATTAALLACTLTGTHEVTHREFLALIGDPACSST